MLRNTAEMESATLHSKMQKFSKQKLNCDGPHIKLNFHSFRWVNRQVSDQCIIQKDIIRTQENWSKHIQILWHTKSRNVMTSQNHLNTFEFRHMTCMQKQMIFNQLWLWLLLLKFNWRQRSIHTTKINFINKKTTACAKRYWLGSIKRNKNTNEYENMIMKLHIIHNKIHLKQTNFLRGNKITVYNDNRVHYHHFESHKEQPLTFKNGCNALRINHLHAFW